LTKTRFLFVVRGAEAYGTARKLNGLMRNLVERGHEVDLYAFGSGSFVDGARANGKIGIHLDDHQPTRFVGAGMARLLTFARTFAGSVGLSRRLSAYLRENAYSAVVFCEHGLLLAIGLAARLNRVKAFWLMPNLVSGDYPLDLNRRIYAYAFRHFGVVPIANSAATLASLGRAAAYGEKIDLGVDPAELGLSTLPAAPAPRPPFNLLVMARLDPSKGQLLLLQAMLSTPAFADLRLVLCGGPTESEYADAIRAEISRASAEHRVDLLARVDDPVPHFLACDVVASTRLDPEPFGLAIVEAMFAGKPVLTHALGGPKDIVVDGVTGWHIGAPTLEAFADGLARMLSDQGRWREMGLAGRRRAESHYTLTSMASAFLDIVSRRLAERDLAQGGAPGVHRR
jgi:glycosyltransferase involved in cell wall biosynthesis